ncbi:uncharacterized protein LOC126894469 isoform X2 [Daktulosphaira vitifoliae]|uniref:uncharacterized protein LOC126894469 isoform X2 n=1 Tax=Daktulosphaira vitifoliae TaxID=58002 RepID=UPI0021AA8CFF|nr:uncharacterized protein LOC126894469 isoform X2 [Daktulosphaira vitifoliae]
MGNWKLFYSCLAMPPGVTVATSSISSGYAACSIINMDRQLDSTRAGREHFSEPSDFHLSSASSSSSSSAGSGESAELSDKEQIQVESCYRGLKTQVYVCGSMANLYLHNNSSTAEGSWDLKFTGIPVVLYDSGETRSRDKPRIQILLVERGTCFALWQDTIDNLTSYKVSSQGFHTMCLSTDHTQHIGLSFDCAEAAQQLWTHIDRLTSDPENIQLSGPGSRSKHGRKQKNKTTPVRRLPDKSHISQPCCFEHITNVEVADKSRYFSLQNLLPTPAMTVESLADV